MTFLQEVSKITIAARTNYVRAAVEKDADVLRKFFEKKIKDLVLNEASVGGSFIKLNLWEFTFDYISSWSIEQLLYEDIYDGYVPVFERLFGEGSLFEGFEVLYTDDKNFNLIWETDPNANRVEIKQEPATPEKEPASTPAEAPGAPKKAPFLGLCDCYPCDCDPCACYQADYNTDYNTDYSSYYDELNKAIHDLYYEMYAPANK